MPCRNSSQLLLPLDCLLLTIVRLFFHYHLVFQVHIYSSCFGVSRLSRVDIAVPGQSRRMPR